MKTNNNFSISYYEDIIKEAKNSEYKFVTINEYINLGYPETNYFILRHDLDKQPQTLKKQLDIESKHGVRSTIFARVTANEYNVLSYPVINLLRNAENEGFEIGLHSNFIEYATINKLEPIKVLDLEYKILNNFFDIRGLAPHRDLNYTYNSLPYIQENWNKIKSLGFQYESYDNRIFSSSVYINEGFSPHLRWRNDKPEDVIKTVKTIYMTIHNHWWYKDHPFEEWQ